MPVTNEALLHAIERLEDKVDTLPCRDHAERIVRSETKVKELNDIRQLVRSTVVRWLIPILLGGAFGGGFLFELLK